MSGVRPWYSQNGSGMVRGTWGATAGSYRGSRGYGSGYRSAYGRGGHKGTSGGYRGGSTSNGSRGMGLKAYIDKRFEEQDKKNLETDERLDKHETMINSDRRAVAKL